MDQDQKKQNRLKHWSLVAAVVTVTIVSVSALWSYLSRKQPHSQSDSKPQPQPQQYLEFNSTDTLTIECKEAPDFTITRTTLSNADNNLNSYYCHLEQQEEKQQSPSPPVVQQRTQRVDRSSLIADQWKDDARIAFGNGNFTKALALYDQILSVEPENAQVYLNRARVYLKLNLHECVISSAEVAFQLDESKPDALYLKALSCMALDEFEVAYETLKFMLKSPHIDKKQRIIVKKKISECRRQVLSLACASSSSTMSALSVSPPPPPPMDAASPSPGPHQSEEEHHDNNNLLWNQNRITQSPVLRVRSVVDPRTKSYELVLDELVKNASEKARLLPLDDVSVSPGKGSIFSLDSANVDAEEEEAEDAHVEIDIPECLALDEEDLATCDSDSEASAVSEFHKSLKKDVLAELRNRTGPN